MSGDGLEEPCSSRQVDARLAIGPEGSEKPELTDILQQITTNEKKKKSRLRKWSGESRLNPLLPSGDNKGGFVVTN